MSAIEVEDLSVCYGKQRVLEKIHLRILPGQIYSLVGLNGAGKSTLIKSILDFIDIESGSIRIFGQTHSNALSRESVAYLPEKFVASSFLTGYEFLDYMLSLYGVSISKKTIDQMVADLDLKVSALNHCVGQYSKGMTQKLGLAACFLSNKPLVILDEPMSGLDPKARVLVKHQLKALKNKGSSIFFCSHLLGDVGELSDCMAVLNEGKLAFVGEVEDYLQLYNTQDIEKAFMKSIDNSDLIE